MENFKTTLKSIMSKYQKKQRARATTVGTSSSNIRHKCKQCGALFHGSTADFSETRCFTQSCDPTNVQKVFEKRGVFKDTEDHWPDSLEIYFLEVDPPITAHIYP